MVKGCKIGAVFAYNGDYFVYVGINARRRKPLIAVHAETRHTYKFPSTFFERVRAASK